MSGEGRGEPNKPCADVCVVFVFILVSSRCQEEADSWTWCSIIFSALWKFTARFFQQHTLLTPVPSYCSQMGVKTRKQRKTETVDSDWRGEEQISSFYLTDGWPLTLTQFQAFLRTHRRRFSTLFTSYDIWHLDISNSLSIKKHAVMKKVNQFSPKSIFLALRTRTFIIITVSTGFKRESSRCKEHLFTVCRKP